MRATRLVVSLLLGEDPPDQGDDDFGFTAPPSSRPIRVARTTDTPAPPTARPVSAAYGVGALGLLLMILVALALPTFILSPCPSGQDCSRHLNVVKVALMAPGLLTAFLGLLVGAVQAYRAQSG